VKEEKKRKLNAFTSVMAFIFKLLRCVPLASAIPIQDNNLYDAWKTRNAVAKEAKQKAFEKERAICLEKLKQCIRQEISTTSEDFITCGYFPQRLLPQHELKDHIRQELRMLSFPSDGPNFMPIHWLSCKNFTGTESSWVFNISLINQEMTWCGECHPPKNK